MEIRERKLKGVFEIILKPHIDERGFFMRTFDDHLFKKAGLINYWVQENHARSIKKGTIRGLHFQFPPFSETKLIRPTRGSVFDVFVDLRMDSPTFGQWDSLVLSEENKICVYIPRGFAHGYCTLSNCSEIIYKVDNFYSPENEGGIIWNDKDLNIEWPEHKPILSEKDTNNMKLEEFIAKYRGIEVNG